VPIHNSHYLIAVTGSSGSGKTFLISRVLQQIGPEKAAVFNMDNYYHPLEKQPLDIFGNPNFDRPESVNLEKLYQDLIKVISGERVKLIKYTYNLGNPVQENLVIEPRPLIFIEGIFVLNDPRIKELADLCICMHAPNSVKLNRRIKRDREERGYNEEDVKYKFQHHVIPAEMEFIEPVCREADMIISSTGKMDQIVHALSASFNEIYQELVSNPLP